MTTCILILTHSMAALLAVFLLANRWTSSMSKLMLTNVYWREFLRRIGPRALLMIAEEVSDEIERRAREELDSKHAQLRKELDS